MRKRFSDYRTAEGKKLRAIIRGLVEDLGGATNCTTAQMIVLSRIEEKLQVLARIGAYVDLQPSILNKKGELIGCLGRGYTTYAESVRRDLEALYAFGGRTQSKVPSLEEYIKRVKTVEGSAE